MGVIRREIGHAARALALAILSACLSTGCGRDSHSAAHRIGRDALLIRTVGHQVKSGRDDRSPTDLLTSSRLIRALKAVRLPRDHPSLHQAEAFITRCQRSDADDPERGVLAALPAGSGAGAGPCNRGRPFGTATCLGVMGLLAAGVPPDDPRILAAVDWLGRHYSFEVHPGMYRPREGLYAFYYEFANAMQALGRDEIRDGRGRTHEWRADLSLRLVEQQAPDGGWSNPEESAEADRDGRVVVTGLALLTLRRIGR